ncbi:MAG: hypothetical protein AAF125_03510 [Chloroflexota bacterium]
MPKPINHRTEPSAHHWRKATIVVRKRHRARLYWTPDPERSRVLRILKDNETVEFVPDIKYGHWVMVRVGHQMGWVNMRAVDIQELEQPPVEQPASVDPKMFLEEDTVPVKPRPQAKPPKPNSRDEDDTMYARPASMDPILQAAKESVETAPLEDRAQAVDTEEVPVVQVRKSRTMREAEAAKDHVSLSDLRRLIRHLAGNVLGSNRGSSAD